MKRSDIPEGGFRCLAIDPPWAFATRSAKGKARSAEKHYSTMTLDDIKALDVEGVSAADAWMFLWTTGTHLPQALELLPIWDFRYSGMGFVWIKLTPNAPDGIFHEKSLHMGMGYTTRKNAEFCLIGRRGNPKRLRADIHEVVIAPRREHSRKPDKIRERIEQFCEGPRLDMFGRETFPGWVSFGNETTKFDEGAK